MEGQPPCQTHPQPPPWGERNLLIWFTTPDRSAWPRHCLNAPEASFPAPWLTRIAGNEALERWIIDTGDFENNWAHYATRHSKESVLMWWTNGGHHPPLSLLPIYLPNLSVNLKCQVWNYYQSNMEAGNVSPIRGDNKPNNLLHDPNPFGFPVLFAYILTLNVCWFTTRLVLNSGIVDLWSSMVQWEPADDDYGPNGTLFPI